MKNAKVMGILTGFFHLFDKTEYNARDYSGEWARILSGMEIWSVDMVGDHTKPLFQMDENNRFVKLLKDREKIWP
jgi:hypothetical protein